MKPGAKVPGNKGWQDEATTDPAIIASWFGRNPALNYGVRTGLGNDIIVVDLDGPAARQWWSDQGFEDSTAMVTSPRVDGGVHHYFSIEGVEIPNSKSKIGPGVDIRGEGGYVVGPGSRTPEGAYTGDISNIPPAPQALLDLIPERQSFATYDPEEFAGVEHATEATDTELADIEHIRNWLMALPTVWAPGAGWHDTVFRSCCWLWRMVRTPSYALTEDKAIELLLTYTPVYPDWAEDKILEQWESARDQTRGQYADPPAENLPKLLDFLDVCNLLPSHAPRSRAQFLDLVSSPQAKPRDLIDECFAAGLDELQTASVVAGSAARAPFAGDYGARKLWREVEAGAQRAESAREAAAAVLPPEPEQQRTADASKPVNVPLLNIMERERVRRDGRWWGDEYLEWAKEMTTSFNAPYHRANRWTILSCVFSTVGKIAMRGGRDKGLNLYIFTSGETTTGKSEAAELMRTVFEAHFSEDDPDIGGNPSLNALIEKLVERDGKSTLFRADEAHGQIAEMKNAQWKTGLAEALTDLYEGRVPKILRIGNKDASHVDARTYFSIHYMGTFEGVSDVLEPSDWASGLLPRFVWVIGGKHERSREAMRLPLAGSGDEAMLGDLMQRQWSSQWRQIEMRLQSVDGPSPMEIPEDVQNRLLDVTEEMYRIADERPSYRDRLYPSVGRLRLTILKAACLVALSDGRLKVELLDLLIAIEQAEEWMANLLRMVSATDETPLARNASKLERMIEAKGGTMRLEEAHRLSPVVGQGARATNILIDQLTSEGRIHSESGPDGARQLRINRGVAA